MAASDKFIEAPPEEIAAITTRIANRLESLHPEILPGTAEAAAGDIVEMFVASFRIFSRAR